MAFDLTTTPLTAAAVAAERELAPEVRSPDGVTNEILLLQRQLALDPGDASARARLKELLRQKGVTGTALDLPAAPENERREWWLDVLPRLQHSAWQAFELGHDSNINSGTANDVVDIPLLNYRSLTLDRALVGTPSYFAGVRTGVVERYPLGPQWSLRAGGMAALRYNEAEYVYLPHSYEGEVVLERYAGLWRFALGASGTQRWVAGYQALARNSFNAELARVLAGRLLASLFVERSRNRYPLFEDTETDEDYARVTLSHAPSGLQGSLHFGRERASGKIKDLDRDFFGVSAAWVIPAGARGRLRLAFSAFQADYRQSSPLFLTTREDQNLELSAAYEYPLGRHWTVTPRVVHEKNRSNLDLTRYERTQCLVEARRIF